jgi:hypothetical protein
MPRAGCGSCGKARAARKVSVTLPGQQPRTVTEAAARQLTRGVKGATIKPTQEKA